MKLTPEGNQPEIDTIRLILTLDCNLKCSYCCNKLESVYSRFVKKSIDEIDFSRYRNVCLTGGEPFLYKLRSGK
jgi:molybdenum cofactor biosynthesis enzyme MoaA